MVWTGRFERPNSLAGACAGAAAYQSPLRDLRIRIETAPHQQEIVRLSR